MNKASRKLLFYLFLLIFLASGYGIVVFALGYKYDYVNNKLLKTGSFQIKTNVPAEVYVNDDLKGQTSFLGNSFSKTLLLPKSYSIRVQAPEYFPWQKNIDIIAGQLAEYPVIHLLPLKINKEIVASVSFAGDYSVRFDPDSGLAIASSSRGIESIGLASGKISKTALAAKPAPNPDIRNGYGDIIEIESPDGNKVMWFQGHEIWVKWLNDSNYQPFKKKGDAELITRFTQPITDVQWYRDSNHLIADVGGTLKFIESNIRGGVNSYDLAVISSPFYFHSRTDSVYFFEGNMLIRISLDK